MIAQKTLLIGLGSNGYDVVNSLVKRLNWEYGGLDRVPWLKVLCLETADYSPDNVLGDDAKHIRVGPNDYLQLFSQPQLFDPKIELSRWLDLGVQAVSPAITAGAANVRMLGRLAFLFEPNVTMVHDEVRTRLLALRNLSPEEALRKRGNLPDGTNPPVEFRAVNNNNGANSESVVVYIIGTLCGGTCSGSFIDMGYLIQNKFGQGSGGNPLASECVAVLSLPHKDHDPTGARRQRANAYAAGVELNHFLSGQSYHVKYPFDPTPTDTAPVLTPFSSTYLVAPRNGSGQAYNALRLNIAQFMHTSIFDPAAQQVCAQLINNGAAMMNGSSGGAPLLYATFGTSAIEFPAYLVAQGACYKLGVEALDEFLSPHLQKGVQADAVRVNALAISTENVVASLLKVPGALPDGTAPTLRVRGQKMIESGAENARVAGKGAGGELDAIQMRLDSAFSEGNAGTMNDGGADLLLSSNAVPRQLNANAAELLPFYRERVAKWAFESLTDIERGPSHCEEVLADAQSWLETRLRELNDQSLIEGRSGALEGARSDCDTARNRVFGAGTDPIVGFYFARRASVAREVEHWIPAAHSHLDARLDTLMAPIERNLWAQLLPFIKAVRAKTSGAEETSIREQAKRLRELCQEKFDAVDGAKPPLNGESLFAPRQTIREDLERFWGGRDVSERTEARRKFLGSWRVLPKTSAGAVQDPVAFFAPDNASPRGEALGRGLRFDAESLARNARPLFDEFFKRDITTRSELRDPARVGGALNASEIFLHINTQNPDMGQLQATNAAQYAFFQGGHDAASSVGTPAHEVFETITRAGGAGLRFEDGSNAQSAVFLRGFTGFPFGAVEGFQNQNQEQNNLRSDYEQYAQKEADSKARGATLHSRADVRTWFPFYGDRDDRSDWRKGLFLSALTLPKNVANDAPIIEIGGQAFVYTPAQPFGVGRPNMGFGRDLRVVAQTLRAEEARPTNAQHRILGEVQSARSSLALPQIVAALERLYNNVGQLRLSDPSSQNVGPVHELVDDKRAFDYLRAFWREIDPSISKALEDRFTLRALQPNVAWRERDATHLSPGFYCTLGTRGETYLAQTPEDVPLLCPSCGAVCRVQ